MVKTLKVVDVAPPQDVENVVEEIVEVEAPQVSDNDNKVEVEDAVPDSIEIPMESKETDVTPKAQYITCETCNQSILMKTYKYSHKKLCQSKNAPTPPPPPPTPEPEPEPKKEKPKRMAKPKQKKEEVVVEPPPEPKFDGRVSFNELQPDPYTRMRQERLMIRQQRVKSLISQAI